MADIFISYAREDRERAADLARALENRGWSVWWDRKIPPGKTFSQVIEAELEAAKCVIVLWSNNSVKSEWVVNEAELAAKRGSLIPAIIEAVRPPPGFSSIQSVDLTHWYGTAPSHLRPDIEFDPLIEALKAVFASYVAAYTSPVPPPKDLKTKEILIDAPAKGRKGRSFGKRLVGILGKLPLIKKRPSADRDFMDEEPQEVRLGASAPSAVRPGDEFTARFIAYIEEAEEKIKTKLRRLSPLATSHLDIKRCRWRPNTEVKVILSGRGLEVEEAMQSFLWQAPHVIVDFDVKISPEVSLGTTTLKFDAFIGDIRVAKLRIDLQITDTIDQEQRKEVTTHCARTAFASYSSKDRGRVVDRLASVRINAGIDVFLDCLSMKPGEEWKSTIAREILKRDQFLLFWSQAAAKSKWVTWEWQTALNEKGKQDIQIHPLQFNVPPPGELSDLHFNDIFMALRDSTVSASGK